MNGEMECPTDVEMELTQAAYQVTHYRHKWCRDSPISRCTFVHYGLFDRQL